MEERKIADAIRQDNNRKAYCLQMLEKMVYGIDAEPVDLEALYNEDGAIWGVMVHFASGGTICVNVEGDSPLAMVQEIIKKAELA
ncbi:hypothetical protein [uncultured Dialister sp.]|jgi:hypothetical protein|uniref:hypothetical protein n=1 Tax=uncultured Dialister sp. TaxID=278064 RepID=UPI002070845F|nr:hypothetical protein [uncultured Dialister sp.]DAV65484.1 MAG TPA: hypothetical protein [Caudoviricetes sp.]